MCTCCNHGDGNLTHSPLFSFLFFRHCVLKCLNGRWWTPELLSFLFYFNCYVSLNSVLTIFKALIGVFKCRLVCCSPQPSLKAIDIRTAGSDSSLSRRKKKSKLVCCFLFLCEATMRARIGWLASYWKAVHSKTIPDLCSCWTSCLMVAVELQDATSAYGMYIHKSVIIAWKSLPCALMNFSIPKD